MRQLTLKQNGQIKINWPIDIWDSSFRTMDIWANSYTVSWYQWQPLTVELISNIILSWIIDIQDNAHLKRRMIRWLVLKSLKLGRLRSTTIYNWTIGLYNLITRQMIYKTSHNLPINIYGPYDHTGDVWDNT